MSAFTDYAEGQIIGHMYRTLTWSKPTGAFFALYTAAPGEAGGGTEVTGGSYARVNLAPSDANWAAPVSGDGHTENLNPITYAAPTANWGSVVATAQFDAAAGNMLVYGSLAQAKTINNGDAAPSFPAGAFDFTVA